MKTRDDIAADVAADLNIAKGQAEDITKKVFERLASSLRQGDDVRIHGLGTFEVKDTKERQGRNPSTGEAITIAAGRKVSFKPTAELKKGL